jgi:tetratricopeptide (TPR) repeat protein
MGIPAYVAFFTKNKDAFWTSEQKALGGQPLLYTAIKMSIDKLKAQSPEDYTLAVAVSMLNTSKIERALIEKAYTALNAGDMAGFGKLLDVALISQEEKDAYKIHDYVRDVILKTAERETLTSAANLNAKVFLALFPKKIEDCVEVFEKNPNLVQHLKSFMKNIDCMDPDDAMNIGTKLYYYTYYFMRDYPYCVDVSKTLTKLARSGRVENPFLLATYHNTNSFMTFLTQDMNAAIQECKLARLALERIDPEEARSELVLLIANNLAWYYFLQGNTEAVQKCLEEAQALQAGHADAIGNSIVDELKVYIAQDKGHFEASIKVLDSMIKRANHDLELNKVDGHYIKSLKAHSLLKLRKVQEAYELCNDSYMHAVESSDGQEDSEVVARVLIYLSQAQSSLGRYQEAENSAKRAVAIFDRELMGTHKSRRQALSHAALGDAYFGQNKYKKALQEYQYAESIYMSLCTHFKFDDMSELYLKFVKVAIVLDEVMLAKQYNLKHRKTFSIDHPRYVEIMVLSDRAKFY